MKKSLGMNSSWAINEADAASHGGLMRFWLGLAAGFAGALLAFVAGGFGGWSSLEATTYDWRASFLAAPSVETDRIRMVFIDQASLDWAREVNGVVWPWPREMYAAIADFCRRGGASAVAVDMIFSEPSFYGAADDAALAASFKAAKGSVVVAALGKDSGRESQWPKDAPSPAFTVEGYTPDARGDGGFDFPRGTFPIPELRETASVLANVSISPDPDGVYRRVPLFGVFDGRFLPSLGLAARVAADPSVPCRLDRDALWVGGAGVPLDSGGRALLRFRGPSATHTSYAAAAVLQSEIRMRNGEAPAPLKPEDFKGKYVFIGATAPGLFDLRASPLGGVYSGSEIHATFLDNLLTGDFIREVSLPAVIGWMFAAAMGCGGTMALFGGLGGVAASAVVWAAVPVAVSFGAYRLGYWMPLVAPEIAVALTVALVFAARYAIEGRQKRQVKNAFSRYLSPVVIEELLRHPELLSLGGERRVLSIFFSDLQGFTTLSEKMEPETLTAFLNDYLSAMTEIIQDEGGTIDKYEGDAIIAFWNAPLEYPDHAMRAVRAALKLPGRAPTARAGFPALGRQGELVMRIGLNTGPAVVGNMGSRTRFDYTMLGDAVNLAARLEGVNKQFGTRFLISETTKGALGGATVTREVARVKVVGRAQPVNVYEPLTDEELEARRDDLATFDKALSHYYRGRFSDALELFRGLADRDPPPGPIWPGASPLRPTRRNSGMECGWRVRRGRKSAAGFVLQLDSLPLEGGGLGWG